MVHCEGSTKEMHWSIGSPLLHLLSLLLQMIKKEHVIMDYFLCKCAKRSHTFNFAHTWRILQRCTQTAPQHHHSIDDQIHNCGQCSGARLPQRLVLNGPSPSMRPSHIHIQQPGKHNTKIGILCPCWMQNCGRKCLPCRGAFVSSVCLR